MKSTIELNDEPYDCSKIIEERFGIDAKTVRRLAECGQLPAPVWLGRHPYFQRAAIDKFLLDTASRKEIA
jgi:hypothetical protein